MSPGLVFGRPMSVPRVAEHGSTLVLWRWALSGALCVLLFVLGQRAEVSVRGYREATAITEVFIFRCATELPDVQLCFNLILRFPFLISLQ